MDLDHRSEALTRRLERLARCQAPRRLRDKIMRAVATEKREVVSMRQPWRSWTLAIGAAAAAAGVFALAAPRYAERAMAITLVETARSPMEHTTGTGWADDATIRQWLESQVGYTVDIPVITDAVLIRAGVSEMGGTKAAALVYLLGGSPMTYFAFPSSDRGDGAPVRAVRAKGYTVAMWTEHGGARALAAQLELLDVRKIAEACRAKAMLD